MASCRRTEDAILADDQLLYAIGSSNLHDELSDFRIPVATITTNYECGALSTFRNGLNDAGNKRLAIILLLEDFDLLSKTGAMTIRSLKKGYGGVMIEV